MPVYFDILSYYTINIIGTKSVIIKKYIRQWKDETVGLRELADSAVPPLHMTLNQNGTATCETNNDVSM
jgi:hypothetical protein